MEKSTSILEPFSYVDNALSFPYFNLTPNDFDELKIKFDDISSLHDKNRNQFLYEIKELSLKLLFDKYQTIYYHEWHHCLQAIYYPYWYLQSWRELSIAFKLLNELRHSNENYKFESLNFKNARLELPEMWRNTILYPSMVHCIDIKDESFLVPAYRSLDDIRPRDITLIDLIENATSIFQFKISINGEGDGNSYKKWIYSQKCSYSNVFHLLCNILDIDEAYIALPPLVQLSFHTTWPLTTFINLTNFISNFSKTAGDLKLLGTDFIYYMLLKKLHNNGFDFVKKGCPNVEDPSENDPCFFMDFDSYSSIISETKNHSIYPLALKYIDLIKDNPDFLTILFHPYKILNNNSFINNFQPALTTIRIHNTNLKVRDSVSVISHSLMNMSSPLGVDVAYSVYLPEILKRKDIAFSLCTDLNLTLEHNCHHEKCLYFNTNICRRWSAIPQDYQKCGFPKWFELVTGRKINFKSNSLDKI